MNSSRYFDETSAPANLEAISKNVLDFVSINQNRDKRIVLVTSGGTTVPLETNTVRFLDNFSAGTRGATSAEYFIEAGYAVIFLHRQFSLEPYTRKYTHSKNCFLDLLELKGNDVCIKEDHLEEIKDQMLKYQKATSESLLLKLSFTTVAEYLFLLRSIALLLVPMGNKAMFYLAAAVSDFYIPQSQMAEHKIQSGDGKLHLDLDQVPKIIKPLVEEWAFNAFTVSFKLETDDSILISKSKAALERYGHSCVVANLLLTRKFVVWLVTKDHETIEIRLSKEELETGVEIEKYIVSNLVQAHTSWISLQKNEAKALSSDLVATSIDEVPSSESEFGANSEEEEIEEDDEDSDIEPEVIDLALSGEGSEEEEGDSDDLVVVKASSSSRVKMFKPKAVVALEHSYVASDSSCSDREDSVKVKKPSKKKFATESADNQADVGKEQLEEGGIEVDEPAKPPADYSNQDYLDLIVLLKRALAHEFKSSTISVASTGLRNAPLNASLSNEENALATLASTLAISSSTETEALSQDINVTILNTNNSRIHCPLARCTKSFLNVEGIKYHLLNFIHDITNLGSEGKEDQALVNQIEDKLALVPSNLLPIEIPWTFNTKERKKPLLLKVRLASQPKSSKKLTATHSSESEARLPKALRMSGEAAFLTPKLTKSTGEFKVTRAPHTVDGSNFTDSVEFTPKIDHASIYPESFTEGKYSGFAFSARDRATLTIPLLDSITRDKGISTTNCGLSVWALDWVPNESAIQYLAVGGYMSYAENYEYGVKQTDNLRGVIQIWMISRDKPAKLSMSISHNFGKVLDLKWCPNMTLNRHRLGILAAVFGDGSCRVVPVPHPLGIVEDEQELPIGLDWKKSVFECCFDDCGFTKIVWSSRNWLFAGCSNGFVCVWDLGKIFNEVPISEDTAMNPLLYYCLHDSVVTVISLIEKDNNSCYLISASADGACLLTDMRDPDSGVKLTKIQGIISALCSVNITDTVIVAEELRIRGYQMADGMLETIGSNVYSQHKGTIWAIDHSPFFPFIASASSDGYLLVSNSCRPLKKKIGGVFLYSICQVSLDDTTQTLTFNEKLQEKKIEEIKFSLYNPRAAIHQVKWNPNRKSRDLLACAGLGWFRIQSAYMQ